MTWRECGGSAPETVQPPTWGERSKQCGCKVGGVIHVPGGPSPAYTAVYVGGGGYAAAHNPQRSAEPFFSAECSEIHANFFWVVFRLIQRLFCLRWDSLLLVMCPITAVSPANLTVWQLGCFAEQSYISCVNSRGYTVLRGSQYEERWGRRRRQGYWETKSHSKIRLQREEPCPSVANFCIQVWKMIVLEANVKPVQKSPCSPGGLGPNRW